MTGEPIRTARLDLVSLPPAFLEASLAAEPAGLDALLGAAVPEAWRGEARWIRLRLDALRADRGLQPWLLRAIVLRAERRMVGHIGFHGPPGAPHLEPFAPGGLELGYTVFERNRRRGYAREACAGLLDWAWRTHGVTRFVVSIAADNGPSRALAQGLGFVRVGAHVDEEDGPEDIFARRLEALPQSARR